MQMHKSVSLRRVIHSGYTGRNGIFNQTLKKSKLSVIITLITKKAPSYVK